MDEKDKKIAQLERVVKAVEVHITKYKLSQSYSSSIYDEIRKVIDGAMKEPGKRPTAVQLYEVYCVLQGCSHDLLLP